MNSSSIFCYLYQVQPEVDIKHTICHRNSCVL